ncbi:hypothetical protein BH23ACT10_BH23ACT10_17070 [soil metagenome]
MSVSVRTIVVAAVVAVAAMAVAAVLLLGSRTPQPTSAASAGNTDDPAGPRTAVAATLDAQVTRVATGPGAPDPLSLVDSAPTVVLAAGDGSELPAAQLALRLGVPLVISPTALSGGEPSDHPTAAATPAAAAIRRLGVERAVVVGGDAVAQAARDSGVADIVEVTADDGYPARPRGIIREAASNDGAASGLPDPGFDTQTVEQLIATAPPPAPATGAAVLVRPRDAAALPLVVAARAVGHAVVTTRATDLRADRRVVTRLAELGDRDRPPRVVLGGPRMAGIDRSRVAAHLPAIATGRQLPGGGQLVINPAQPHTRRYIGLYGVPGSTALGALGEQPVDASVTRAKRLARQYRQVTDDSVTVLPCFEIIATVASGSAGRDGNFANELPIADLEPAVRAARKAGLYVLLDIQPGRTDFLTLAKRYRKLLRRPHVGLALDPEWRLKPRQRHLTQIGSVGSDEVNEVTDWLADLVERNDLPQKMLLIHQFRLSMVRNRERLDTSRDELAYVIQMDGQGPQGTKMETWRAITATPPSDVTFGWKNFYDEDTPVRTPADTMAVAPPPVFVSYQ